MSLYSSCSCQQSVAAVVVTYEPNYVQLVALLETISPQVTKIYLIDNGSAGITKHLAQLAAMSRCHIILNSANIGLAAAQNQGISLALRLGVSYVILFDQDSTPTEFHVRGLIGVVEGLSRMGVNVAGVAPGLIDARVRVHYRQFEEADCKIAVKPGGVASIVRPVAFILASGSVLTRDALLRVGLMEERLFIDLVDIEWSFRAKKMGFGLFVFPYIEMYHTIGDTRLGSMRHELCVHSPLRAYYMNRNLMFLLLERRFPAWFSLLKVRQALVAAFMYCLFLYPRLKYMKMILWGIIDGFLGRHGKCNRD